MREAKRRGVEAVKKRTDRCRANHFALTTRAREENLAKRQKMVPAYTLDWKSIGIGIGIVVGVGMAWYTGGASLVAMSAQLAFG